MIFNSALETGLRSICVLDAGAPKDYDLNQLLAFDHIVVHSGDINGGPTSLHPNTSQRNGELLIRRPLVLNGLLLMQSKGLLERGARDHGIVYRASDLSHVFLNSLENEYVSKLRQRATWAVESLESFGQEVFYSIFNTAFDRWTSEFQLSELQIGGVE